MGKPKGYVSRSRMRGNARNRADTESSGNYASMSAKEYDKELARQTAANSDAENEALDAYQEESKDINDDMRIPWFNDFQYTTREMARKRQVLLSNAIQNHSLAKDTLLYRGIDDAELKRIVTVGKGNRYRNMGFMSTAVTKGSAEDFAKEGGAVVTIRAPKGTKAALADSYQQREALIQRGTVFRVVSHSDTAVTLEIVSQIKSANESVSTDVD